MTEFRVSPINEEDIPVVIKGTIENNSGQIPNDSRVRDYPGDRGVVSTGVDNEEKAMPLMGAVLERDNVLHPFPRHHDWKGGTVGSVVEDEERGVMMSHTVDLDSDYKIVPGSHKALVERRGRETVQEYEGDETTSAGRAARRLGQIGAARASAIINEDTDRLKREGK